MQSLPTLQLPQTWNEKDIHKDEILESFQQNVASVKNYIQGVFTECRDILYNHKENKSLYLRSIDFEFNQKILRPLRKYISNYHPDKYLDVSLKIQANIAFQALWEIFKKEVQLWSNLYNSTTSIDNTNLYFNEVWNGLSSAKWQETPEFHRNSNAVFENNAAVIEANGLLSKLQYLEKRVEAISENSFRDIKKEACLEKNIVKPIGTFGIFSYLDNTSKNQIKTIEHQNSDLAVHNKSYPKVLL